MFAVHTVYIHMYLQLQSIFQHMNDSKTIVVHCIHKTQVWAAIWITVYEKTTYKSQNVILCVEDGEKRQGI